MTVDEQGNLAEQQDEKFKEARAEGKSKQEAAAEASPPETTELRAEEAAEED